MKNDDLKEKFLEYFRQLPVQKLAADFIGVHQDTITDWKKKDKSFSDQVSRAKSEWALKHAKNINSSEWMLERVMRDSFSSVPVQELMDRLDSIEKLLAKKGMI